MCSYKGDYCPMDYQRYIFKKLYHHKCRKEIYLVLASFHFFSLFAPPEYTVSLCCNCK